VEGRGGKRTYSISGGKRGGGGAPIKGGEGPFSHSKKENKCSKKTHFIEEGKGVLENLRLRGGEGESKEGDFEGRHEKKKKSFDVNVWEGTPGTLR